MTPQNSRKLGNVILLIAAIILLVTVVGMAGWTRKIWPTREMIVVAMVLTILAHGFRRRGRGAKAAP